MRSGKVPATLKRLSKEGPRGILSNLWNANPRWSHLSQVSCWRRTRHNRSGARWRRPYRQRGRRLAYLTIIPAIVFLVIGPFNKRRFVRFHAFQSIFYFVAWIAVDICLTIIGHIPFLGWATLFLWPLVSLVLFVILLVLALKAYQGQLFKLPVIGDIAEQQAGA